jgi:release factor glutamine methyltransferase
MKSEIYYPAEDSYLLSETLEKYLSELIENGNNLIVNKKNKNLAPKGSSNQQPHSLENKQLIQQRTTAKQSLPKSPLFFDPFNSGNIKNLYQISILDMGSGSGIQAKTCKMLGFNNILTADINPAVVQELKKQGFKSVKTNLFSAIKKENKFDLIIFNPPYLPDDKLEPKSSRLSTTAGKKGYELIIKFLKQAKNHLNKNAVIFLLFSSLSHPLIIKKQAKSLGYNIQLLSSKKLFFEELFVYKIMISHLSK